MVLFDNADIEKLSLRSNAVFSRYISLVELRDPIGKWYDDDDDLWMIMGEGGFLPLKFMRPVLLKLHLFIIVSIHSIIPNKRNSEGMHTIRKTKTCGLALLIYFLNT
jgi:hypothetical protein